MSDSLNSIVDKLKSRLYELTRNTNSEVLYDQWSRDKKALKNGLNEVGRIFPHYSLHNESHCRTILNNIACIVGESLLLKLSATDIWLLLSAVYFHDTGMIVSSQKEIDLLKSGTLADLIKEAQQDTGHGLHQSAIKFKVEDKAFSPVDQYVNKDWLDAYKFLLAELVRREHAKNASTVINESKNKENSHWINENALPNRLYDILTKVCVSHGSDFRAVLELPFCQTGLDTEQFHPRFIAAMLRMGDLLDVDNKRFSEVMLSSISVLPEDSKLHYLKHASIVNFNLKDTIEISASFENPDAADLTRQWFDWIKDEYNRLSLNWADIRPSSEFQLPKLGQLRIDVKDYIPIDKNYAPEFKIDSQKAIEYLGGENLYQDKYDAIRELVSNAVDSINIRAYLENKERFDNGELDPSKEEFVELMKKYSIDIDFSIEQNAENGSEELKVTIKDTGCGMDLNTINNIMNLGSSSNNVWKKKIVEQMPAFLKPIGTFGIGFQSVFMLTDKVTVKTKFIDTNEVFEFDAYAPKGPKKGKLYVKKLKNIVNDFGLIIGTEISFFFSNAESSSRKEYLSTITSTFNQVIAEEQPKDYHYYQRLFNTIKNNLKHYNKSFCKVMIRGFQISESLDFSKMDAYLNSINIGYFKKNVDHHVQNYALQYEKVLNFNIYLNNNLLPIGQFSARNFCNFLTTGFGFEFDIYIYNLNPRLFFKLDKKEFHDNNVYDFSGYVIESVIEHYVYSSLNIVVEDSNFDTYDFSKLASVFLFNFHENSEFHYMGQTDYARISNSIGSFVKDKIDAFFSNIKFHSVIQKKGSDYCLYKLKSSKIYDIINKNTGSFCIQINQEDKDLSERVDYHQIDADFNSEQGKILFSTNIIPDYYWFLRNSFLSKKEIFMIDDTHIQELILYFKFLDISSKGYLYVIYIPYYHGFFYTNYFGFSDKLFIILERHKIFEDKLYNIFLFRFIDFYFFKNYDYQDYREILSIFPCGKNEYSVSLEKISGFKYGKRPGFADKQQFYIGQYKVIINEFSFSQALKFYDKIIYPSFDFEKKVFVTSEEKIKLIYSVRKHDEKSLEDFIKFYKEADEYFNKLYVNNQGTIDDN